MNINTEKTEKQDMNLPYEQPSIKKYGTMKEFTLGSSGSGTDVAMKSDIKDDPGLGDPILPGIGAENDRDDFFFNDGDDPANQD